MMEQRKHGEVYICKRLRMVRFLKDKGFLPIKTIPDKDNPAYNVWMYQNSVELENAIYEYFNLLKDGKINYDK